MKKIQLIVSLLAIVVVIVVVIISMQSGTTRVHRPSAADNAFATLKAN
jgi:hypothetical protein